MNPERKTPAIDSLANGGFRFPSAVAPVPLTLPSHATILTGLEPDRHGIRDNGQTLSPTAVTLAEVLSEAGYRTGAFISGYPLSGLFGTAQGFDHYDDDVAEGQGAWLERRAPATVDAAAAWLQQVSNPWFLWVHFYDPHLPYEPPSALVDDGPRGAYDGEVRFVDRAIARLLKSVGDKHRLVVFAADHGESLGEHGEASHGYFIYESTIRVPMVFHFPGHVSPGTSDAAARLADIAPTVVDLLDLDGFDEVDGVSLTPLFGGEEMEIPPAAIESVQPWSSYGWAPLRGIRQDDWKFIHAPRPELYNLSTDSSESENVIESHPTLAFELRSLIDGGTSDAPRLEGAPLDPEVADRLRSLGYVSSGSPPARGSASNLADPKDQLPLRALLTQADQALEAGEFREAVRLADQVLAKDPKNRFALSRSALALLRAGFVERAIRRLERVVELDPEQSESRTLLAETLTKTRNLTPAITHWQELVARQPSSAHLWSQLGSTLGMAGRTADAVTALTEAQRREPDNPDRATRLAFAHFANQQPQLAVDRLLEVRAATGSAFEQHGTLGVFFLAADRFDEAIESLEKSTPEHPDYAEGRFEWARWAAERGALDSARAALEECLAARPDLRDRAAAHPSLAPLLVDLPASTAAAGR